ncbi:YppG family protein [Bacillus sp. MUM 116]|uniref:YppG family protein n=1 Tax=Bacillus sp. MUM 116 TaxID=1678002 RepID=UPI002108ABE2|nr:YppG family protein [Bacillus sp. MUM 116]
MYGNYRPNPYFNYGLPGQRKPGWSVDFGRNNQVMSFNQPFPYPPPIQNYDWNQYQQQNPYLPKMVAQNYNQGMFQQQMPISNQQFSQKDSQFLFQNPLQPQEKKVPNQYMPMNGYPMMNPYPKQNMLPKQPGGMKSIMNSFKSQDGTVDLNKMMNTAGQMVNAVNQVSTLVKGLGGMFKP